MERCDELVFVLLKVCGYLVEPVNVSYDAQLWREKNGIQRQYNQVVMVCITQIDEDADCDGMGTTLAILVATKIVVLCCQSTECPLIRNSLKEEHLVHGVQVWMVSHIISKIYKLPVNP